MQRLAHEIQRVVEAVAHNQRTASCTQAGIELAFEATVIAGHKKIKMAREHIVARFDDAGHFLGCLGVVQDISQHRDLESKAQLLESIVESAPVSIFIKDKDGRFIWANERTAQFTGHRTDELIGKTVFDLVDASTAEYITAQDAEFFATYKDTLQETLVPHADGGTRLAITTKTAYKNAHGDVLGFIAFGRDVSDVWETRAELRRQVDANESYRTVLEGLPDLVYAKNSVGEYLLKNAAFESAWKSLQSLPFTLRAPTERALKTLEEQATRRQGIVNGEVVFSDERDVKTHYHATVAPVIRADDGGHSSISVTLRNVDDIKALEHRLRRQANLDPLTGASNRRALLEVMRRHFESSANGQGKLSLIMFDLDHFKAINDEHGHAVGDAALVSASATAKGLLRPVDTLGRWGGEEFLVCLPGSDLSNAAQVAERLRLGLGALTLNVEPTLDDEKRLSASFGVASTNQRVSSLEQLISHADKATYQAKRAGRNCVACFEG